MTEDFDDFWYWLIKQSVGLDVWDRNHEKLYALPVWLELKKTDWVKDHKSEGSP